MPTKKKTTSIYDLAAKVAAIPAEDCNDANKYAPQIIEIFRGTRLFMQYDEHYGDMDRASGGRFHLSRGVRNSPTWGWKLFKANNERPAPARRASRKPRPF